MSNILWIGPHEWAIVGSTLGCYTTGEKLGSWLATSRIAYAGSSNLMSFVHGYAGIEVCETFFPFLKRWFLSF